LEDLARRRAVAVRVSMLHARVFSVDK
jgi:hypothetical protein